MERTDRAVVGLGVAGVAVVAGLVGFVPLVHVVRHYRGIDLTGRQWWPVAVVECALALGLLVAVAGGAGAVRRRWRALGGSSPRSRLPLLIALLPGVLLGGVLELPFDASVSWAADHSPATAAARRQLAAERAEMQRSPTIRVPALPAPDRLARLLLRPEDLGVGWYDGFGPNPSTLDRAPYSLAAPAARSVLVRTHREGVGWALAEPMLVEAVRQLPTAGAARAKAAAGREGAFPRRTVRIEGVSVLLSPQGKWATFVVGTRAFEVSLSYRTEGSGVPSLLSLARAAVIRARGR